MFSDRLLWDRPENALAGIERRRRAAGLAILDLTAANPTRVGLPYPVQSLRDAFAAIAADPYDPAPLGLRSAREAIAREYQASGVVVAADRIALTASSSESYALLFKLLCNPHDAVLVPEPSYPLFEYLARLDGIRPVGYRLIYDGGWHIDFDSLAAAHARAAGVGVGVTGGVRAVIVVNPNNPTGSFITASDLDHLARFCAARDLAVISDEVFADYRFGGDTDHAGHDPDKAAPVKDCLASAPALTGSTLTFSLGGLSKSCGLPQLKLGWIVAAGPTAVTASALGRLELIADTYLSVGGPVQRALPRLLELGTDVRGAIRRRVQDNRQILVAALPPGCPCTLLAAEGGWSAILRVPDVDMDLARGRAGDRRAPRPGDEAWAMRLLEDDGILIHPGYLFDMPAGAYLIASLLPEPEVFSRGVERVIACCSDSVP